MWDRRSVAGLWVIYTHPSSTARCQMVLIIKLKGVIVVGIVDVIVAMLLRQKVNAYSSGEEEGEEGGRLHQGLANQNLRPEEEAADCWARRSRAERCMTASSFSKYSDPRSCWRSTRSARSSTHETEEDWD